MALSEESEHLLLVIKQLNDNCKLHPDLLKYVKFKALTDDDVTILMNLLSEMLFDLNSSSAIVAYCSKYVLQLLCAQISFDSSKITCFSTHLRNCVVLSSIAFKHPDVKRFILDYFEKYPSPFEDDFGDYNVATKKRKLDKDNFRITDLQVVQCCYTFLKIKSEFFRTKWNWSKFIEKYENNKNDQVKWFFCQCISIITGMNETQLNLLQEKYLSKQKIIDFTVDFSDFLTNTNVIKPSNQSETDNANVIHSKVLNNVLTVAGIPLTIFKKCIDSTNLIQVKSTQSNLRKVALGIASNCAICIQGPVGSGKTALVEYLASLTGRSLGDGLIKVQLGDQTDSKMLLGTYRCTDIPGEFVWQPGVLTKAVTDGSWLLLEDIDTASMDIATVITSLIENGSLTVPGFRDAVPITTGFQLFVTQRLLPSITGFHKKHSSASTFLEKHLLQINVEPLSKTELIEIIKILYPALTTIASRIVDVFLIFSSEADYVSKTGRFTSTRDLFKWCTRAVIDFDVTSPNSALNVFQDALDIFCCSLPLVDDRLVLSKEICVKLGIIETKAEYFCDSYKPSLSLNAKYFSAGRVRIIREMEIAINKRSKFSFTRPSSCLLERIVCCVNLKEPVLLVGETGTGKTSAIQYLSQIIGQKLIVINMNQQSDSADLLGGYKPVDMKYIIAPIRLQFELLFREYFSVEHNQKFLDHIANCFNSARWSTLLTLMKHSQNAAVKRLQNDTSKNQEFKTKWTDIGIKLNKLSVQLKQQNALAFAFIEGSLVKAIEKGYWVLLDEINLASAETLECLSGLLEGSHGSLSLLERGDQKPLVRHEKFTLFACMNPSTDVGKKDLPAGLRNRFTEFFVEELTVKTDLLLLVNSYLQDLAIPPNKIENIVKFYLNIRKEAVLNLSDGLGHKPHYSLRTLCRALMIASRNMCGTIDRNLYEAFCLSFLTQLDSKSYKIVEQMIAKAIIGNAVNIKSVLNQHIPEPANSADNFVQFEGYWVTRGKLEPEVPKEYVLTNSVRRNLKDLVRVVAIGKLPVLLQGDTSVGKTSLITYLAKSSGNKCVRINNHEHTDLQEYIGSYVADVNGKLVFHEGVLVDAMREGHWIILDELNLAPTDVLEALNRVLDDNRELFIPETQETVKAHPNFMLFATQNPPGAYGGRKILSRAFRNRFVELHFNEIPPNELEIILHKRCEIPPSYCKRIIAAMTELQMRRRGSAAFAGKQGFITLRDLFRWGERYRLAPKVDGLYDWDQHIADEGYLVLAGRVRKVEERNEIAEVLHKHMKREIVPDNLFSLHDKTSPVTIRILKQVHEKKAQHKEIVWTFNMRQLIVLVEKALEFKEPVLLVGETGGGKTTVCRLIAENNGQELVTVNCHMHTESSDFIGGLRPVRERNEENKNKLFEWVDGPLLQAMSLGNIFLADEISLADDSVLERLNSLLEPERSLLLAEKGSDSLTNSSNIIAHDHFHFIGTMNPGGDFGKKELSPALRNRFTEIWCDSCTNRRDLIDIIEHNLKVGVSFGNQQDGSSGIGKCIMDFIEWFKKTEIGARFTISIRDILTWVNFINVCSDKIDISETYTHGACLTFLDSFGSGVTAMESIQSLAKLRNECTDFLSKQITAHGLNQNIINMDNLIIESNEKYFGIKPFLIEKGCHNLHQEPFTFTAPTTIFNTLRLLRGLQLSKAILLEGSPGVGKTSLVSALAKITHHKLLRINLSDQTDVCDLFGSDLPVEGGQGGEFAWRDGPFLQALKNGDWIVLDELNLASQSVLEGLNACLDHRGEIFIPELGKTFYVQPGTRLFACQNPLRQGGSRRGLPKSFLNRFTQVYIDTLLETDLLLILQSQFPTITSDILQKMVEFNRIIVSEISNHSFGHKGSPWEFNLRDLIRWCEVMLSQAEMGEYHPDKYVNLVYVDRMRTLSDKVRVSDIFESVFGTKITGDSCIPYVTQKHVYMGDIKVQRYFSDCEVNLNVLRQEKSCLVLRSQYDTLRSLMYCVNLNWMAILVGSGACGKTKVVKTLSQLTGRELRTLSVNSAMDTTDILGGFEQADYNRQLEEVASKAERLLLSVVQERLLGSDVQMSTALMRRWEEFKVLQKQDNNIQTMADETKIFNTKLANLKDLLQYMIEQKFPETISRQLKSLDLKLQKLLTNVEREGTLNAGGKFEWVDSILIKCLQDGCWLLIDNVNLCSSAVLDRLNALLEPNGVLTIGERGVNDKGEMITIKPHPNFRLFLTMDPKNGEISRAMRNRGLEIYMLNESETRIRNTYDTKAIIQHNGLNSIHLQEILLNIHDYISENTLGEKPSISHLIQSSFLISQQLLRGINLNEAFLSTIMDVYVKTKSVNEFCLNDPISSIKSQLLSLLINDSNHENKLNINHATMKTLNLEENSSFEMIKQQNVLIEQAMVDDCLTEYELYILLSAYSMTSVLNLQLRQSYVDKKLLKDNTILTNVNETICKQLFESFSKGGCNALMPIDSNWLPETLKKCTTISKSNQMLLLLYFCIRQKLTSSSVQPLQKKIVTLTVSQFSKAVADKKLTQFSIDHPLVVYFNHVLLKFDEFFMSAINTHDFNLDIKSTVKAMLLLNWRFVLNEAGDFIIYDANNKNINLSHIISQIIVRYKWFMKHTIKHFTGFVDNESSKKFYQMIDLINTSLCEDFSNFKKIAKRFIKSDYRPLPPTDEKQIDIKTKCVEYINRLSLETGTLADFEKRCTFLLKNIGIRPHLIHLSEAMNTDFDECYKEIDEIKALLEIVNTDSVGLEDVQLLAIQDIYARIYVSKMRSCVFKQQNGDIFQDINKMLTVPIDLTGTFKVYSEQEGTRHIHSLTRSISAYLSNSSALQPLRYLHFNSITHDDFKDVNIAVHSPVLTYAISTLCVSLESSRLLSTSTLGCYKDKSRQLKYLNELLWNNIPSFNSEQYDSIANDSKYITDSFHRFLLVLEMALTKENRGIPEKDVLNICIQKINEIYEQNSESTAMTNSKNKFIEMLLECYRELMKISDSSEDTRILHIANTFCLLNYMKSILNVQLQVIDPLEKVVLKKQYCSEEKKICVDMNHIYEIQNDVFSGKMKTVHPISAVLKTKIEAYEIKENELSKNIAIRPENNMYQNLIKDVTYNVNTLLSEDSYLSMYSKINKCIQALTTNQTVNTDNIHDVLNQSQNWLYSHKNAMKKVSVYNICYPDVVEPILSSLTDLAYGVKILHTLLRKLFKQYEYFNIDLNKAMKNTIRFPVLNETQESVQELIDTCISIQSVVSNKECLEEENIFMVKQEKLRMLKCAIQELYNLFAIKSPHNIDHKNELVVLMYNLIDIFVNAWQTQESEKQKKLEEEQSLYKTKTKCENLSDDEQALLEIKQLFPNHHDQDFSDIGPATLDDPKEMSSDAQSEDLAIITSDDIKFVVDIHSDLMKSYTRNEWLNPKGKALEPDFIHPFLQRYKVCRAMLANIIDSLDHKLDNISIHSLNLLIYISKCYGEGDMLLDKDVSSPSKRNEKSFNFYKDSRVEEVKTCVPVLNALSKRINELLDEWSSHPTLQTINTVLERIYSFPISSPLSRFLTGLEILLSKCNEWEENAHSGVSLSEYSQNITLQIISWRKLELAGWKECIHVAFERAKDSVSKWWFHLYLTIHQFISTEFTITVDQITNTFREFIEKSTLGEYESRLQLLYTFHCHAVNLKKSAKTDTVVSLLWNLYHYYCQFKSNVDVKIKELRSPIEKKLKDFVKIARWNDINYWSIKETVEKTHKTLHKYIKEFEIVLKQPVTVCLVLTNSDSSSSENVGIWDRPVRHTPSQYHYSLDASNYMASPKFKKRLSESSVPDDETTKLMQHSEKYFNKSRSLCKDTISFTAYPTLIQDLDSFVTEIIETSTHLRNLEVSKDLPKNKQKSQAKSILQQKRKALSDLFKTLTQCGLSYKTGLIEMKLKTTEHSEFLLKPIDLKASFEHIRNKGACDRQLLTIWDGCETYFLRSITRLIALENALKQPAQDLGSQNIERCKGFASHLMILAEEQKTKLIESSRHLYYLRHYIHQLSEFDEEANFIKSDSVTVVTDLLTNIMIVMEQYKIILHSCPQQPELDSDLSEILLLDKNNCNAIKYKYDTNWNSCMSQLKLIVSKAQKLKSSIEKIKNSIPSSDVELNLPEYLFVLDVSNITLQLEELHETTSLLKEKISDVNLDSIDWVLTKTKYAINLITSDTEKLSTVSFSQQKNSTEKLINSTLLIIQNIYKKYKVKDSEKTLQEAEQEEKTEMFEENHLKTLILENIFEDISILEMKKIFRKVKKVVDNFYKMSADDIKNSKSLISNILPLLEQIMLMYQYFITQQISAYRVTCKMNSILLNIFTELATKGFCVPPEFAEELEGEGESKQTGGMGLGEGEGEKDVSDKIESEDQLEDAQPADQEKKNENKDCKEEEKGIDMSEDFEGNLQDVDKPEDEESQSNSDSDAEKQMGDTEPNADKLDQQIWGSDDEDNEDLDEEQDKTQKEDEGEGGELEDQQISAKNDDKKSQEEENDLKDDDDKKKEQQKEVNEMEEKEYDDDQTDPYHGNQPQLPEPEPMDLPDDLQLDDGEEKEEQGEENPFDIDNMKDQMPPEKEDEPEDSQKDTDKQEEKDNTDSSDEEDANETDKANDEQMETENPNAEQEENKDEKDSAGIQNKQDEEEDKEDPEKENEDSSALDNTQSNENNIQAMDIDNTETADNIQSTPNQSNTTQSDQISQEESIDKDGVGQSQMEESDAGHRGQTSTTSDISNANKEQEPQEKRSKPGESDNKRSLGESTEPVSKKLKTIDIQEDANEPEESSDNKKADLYQHIQEAKETDTQTLDAATKEQAESQKIQNMEDKDDEVVQEPTEMDTDEPEVDVTNVPKQESEKTESKSKKKSDGKPMEGNIVEEIKDVDVEGDVVETSTVLRGTDSSYHTKYDMFTDKNFDRLSVLQIQEMRNELENQLGTWNEPPASMEAEKTWEKFSAVTANLAQDLSEQLRLVLEPTQASRLRGDFRTGRRINMRKVIPYIASQFRKDKIWLRRTKPSKREYQIVLAIDDSSSMDDNHSKELAFESVALISKALSLLESGQLSILSFGENTEVVHKLTDTFTEKSGMKLLQKFQFQQKKTCVANLVDFATNMLSTTHTTALNAKLLVVVSDGRGIFSEGESYVQQAIRRAKFSDIFMVFVIIDNPENKNSILDIRMPIFSDGKLLGIKSYLDSFPFPFYIILRDINSLPSVLSDALRQWFELVTNVDKV